MTYMPWVRGILNLKEKETEELQTICIVLEHLDKDDKRVQVALSAVRYELRKRK